MKKITSLFCGICFSLLLLSSCSNNVVNIPSGYIGKLLTPTGFSDGILEAGQCDIGVVSGNGQYTSLVLLEATTITAKESFAQAMSDTNEKDKEDHRVMTKTTPLTVDIYIQMSVPKDVKLRNNAFSAITPVPYAPAGPNANRVSVITLEDIYNRFAKMTVRGRVRGIFAKYNDWKDVMDNFEKVNAEIGQMVIETFKTSNVPLDLISIQLSNVKEDQRIWDSRNELTATSIKIRSIDSLGKALKNNPAYIQIRKWEVIEKLLTSPNSANISLIIGDGKEEPMITIPAKK